MDRTNGATPSPHLPIEILSLIFCNLVDRKSILNCSLVSTQWHGPAKVELARFIRDRPYNGQGLVHAIRTRFATDTFPFLSMALFDKLVCNLSELYYHSNPETKQIFAPAHAPDILYHLFWTFLFIDQDVRHPSLRPKVTCNYFIRLLQKEGAYPREYFDKRVLQRIYNDIVSHPLLPAPHLILALQDVDRAITAESREIADLNAGSERRSTNHRQLSFFKNLSNPIKMETFKKIRQWFLKSIREENSQGRVIWNSQDSLTMPHVEDLQEDPVQTDPSDGLTSASPSPSPSPSARVPLYGTRRLPQSRSSTFPRKSPGLHRSIDLKIGTRSDLSMNKSAATLERKANGSASAFSILRHGFTTVPPGWCLEGDGLDHVIRFPKPKTPE